MAVDLRPAQGYFVRQEFDVASAYQNNELGLTIPFRDVGDTNYGICYMKYVQYEAGVAAVAGVAGEVAYYYKLDGYKTFQVCSDRDDSIFAGTVVLGAGVMHCAPADSEYLWVQITGPATLTIALTAGTDGDQLTGTGANDGSLDTVDITSVTTANDCPVVAWAGEVADKEIICAFPF